jgi:hypothetical protein
MLGEISAKLDMVQRVQSEDRTAAASWRTDVRNSLDAVKESVSDIKNRANNNADELADLRSEVEKKIGELRTETDDYRMRKFQAEGAGKLTKVLWAIFSAIGLGGLITFLQNFRAGH